MDPASEALRLGPIEILEGICGDCFVSGKRIVQKPERTLNFSRVRVMLKLLFINICSLYIQRCSVLFTVGKPPDKKDDIDQVHVLVSVYVIAC